MELELNVKYSRMSNSLFGGPLRLVTKNKISFNSYNIIEGNSLKVVRRDL